MKSHSNVERIKSIIITILIAIIFLLIVKNSIARRADRVEFQMILEDLQPVILRHAPKIYM